MLRRKMITTVTIPPPPSIVALALIMILFLLLVLLSRLLFLFPLHLRHRCYVPLCAIMGVHVRRVIQILAIIRKKLEKLPLQSNKQQIERDGTVIILIEFQKENHDSEEIETFEG